MADLADQITGTGLINPISSNLLDLTALENLNNEVSESGVPHITVYNPNLQTAANGPSGNSLVPGSANSPGGSLVNNLLNSAGISTSGTASGDSFWTDIFLRAVIIILGFIFTAIGLSMFGNKAATVIINETKRSFNA